MPGETIDVVFVHGILSSGKAWDQFIGLLEADSDLMSFVRPHRFDYDSPKVSLRPDESIAELDTIADYLATYLANALPDARSIVLVTHSQGGLVVQRYLARVLRRGGGGELARIRHIAMYACPNNGSQFLLSLRKGIGRFWWHPQERELHPIHRDVTETQQTVIRDVVSARGVSVNQCHIPISTYGGSKDRIVPDFSAAGVFSPSSVVDGNHFTVIRPANREALSYTVLKQRLLEVRRALLNPGAALDEGFADRQLRVSVEPPYGSHDGQFQGRESLIREITSDRRSRVHVLAGKGGSGKTRVALEIARQTGRHVWWISMIRVNGCMREVAAQLGIPDSQIEQAWKGISSPTDLVWRFLQERAEPWLLVFDNADDPRDLAAANGAVADGTGWLRVPASEAGMVLVTSRDVKPGTWGTWCAVHTVPPLDAEHGAAMLMEIVGPDGGTSEDARALSEELGGLPLALRAAGRYVSLERAPGRVWTGDPPITSLGGYLTAIRRRFTSAAGGASPGAGQLGLDDLKKILGLSLDLLARRDLPEAAPLLKALACLNIAPIPYYTLLAGDVLAGSGLLAGCTEVRCRVLLEGLAGLGLVDLTVMDGVADKNLAQALTLHPVVHGIFRDDDDVRDKRAEYHRINNRLLLNATEMFDPDIPESWEVWSVLVPHTVEVCRSALLGTPRLENAQVIRDSLELARRTVRYLIVAGLIVLADELVFPIIANCRELGFGPEDREILALRHEKGRLAIERGELSAAESELRQVVAARSRVLGEKNADTLASRHKLAKAILLQGRLESAERELASIAEDERHVRGYDHSDTLVVRHSLARAIFRQHRYPEGEKMLREILAKRCEIGSPTTPETLSVRDSLAYCLIRQGKFPEGEAVARAALGEVPDRWDRPRAMELRHTLSLALLYQGRIPEARSELETLVADRARVLGPEHPETKRAKWLLGKATGLSVGEDQP